jgi:uncharacterized protein YqjF (DUF2071 family)
MNPPATAVAGIGDRCPHDVVRPVLVQHWAEAVFCSWPVDPDHVTRLLPPGVEVDTIDGAAWVSLVPFRMVGLRPPGLPRLPRVGDFVEVNVRTYVRGPASPTHPHGCPAVWFCSLDVPRLAPVAVARLAFRLPYGNAAIAWTRPAPDEIDVVTRRRWPDPARSRLHVRLGEPVERPDPLLVWLTARWGLVTARPDGSRRRFGPVAHEPWPLRRAGLVDVDPGLVVAAGFPRPVADPVLCAAPLVSVRVGAPVPFGGP